MQTAHGLFLPPVVVVPLDGRLAKKLVAGDGEHFHCITLATETGRKRLVAEDGVPRMISSDTQLERR